MKAIICTGDGGPEVLQPAEVPSPVPGAGEVLVRVRATAVNRADILQREGRYPPPPGVTDILGLECAGEVAEVPTGTNTDLQPGDRVMCVLSGGGYAQMVSVPIGQVMLMPSGMPFTDAAAIPEVFITAWVALVTLGAVQEGEVALVHAMASGVGTAAAQICTALGVRCLGTSRSPERAEAATCWGADAVSIEPAGFANSVLAHTDGAGADVIVDLVGGSYMEQNVACLARGGRIVVTGLVGGRRAQIDLADLLARQGRIIGTTLRGRTLSEKADIVRAFSQWALPRFAHRTLRPVVHVTLPIDDVAYAHQLLESGTPVGKVVLAMDADTFETSPE